MFKLYFPNCFNCINAILNVNINYRTLSAFLVFSIGYVINTNAQISYPGRPLGVFFDKNQNVRYEELPASIEKQSVVKNGSGTSNSLKFDQFAVNNEVLFSPLLNGSWYDLPNGTAIWRLGITSEKASSLGITIYPFHLKIGCKLIVYSTSGKFIKGAFTFRNNNESNSLSVEPIFSDSIIIELQLMPGVEDFGSLVIESVGVGFRNDSNEKNAQDEWFGSSSLCNVDINCIPDPEYALQKKSVCRITYGNSGRCTGTLINNTAENGLPYVLTAGHCFEIESNARTALFYFDYESPYCGGGDGITRSVSGSRLVSKMYPENLDFALLKLFDVPPIDYSPVYSGWDITETSFDTTYTIHHPLGDVKKISVNYDDVYSGQDGILDFGSEWIVQNYEIGTTEHGSSGSALFDKNNQVRGVVSTGGFPCVLDIYDFYTKISRAWADYPDSVDQLKYWLDPLNSGITSLGNYDPLVSHSDEITNIDSNILLKCEKLENGWGYISGHNSLNSKEFVEKFYQNGSKYLYALEIDIAQLSVFHANSSIIFKIWEGERDPEKLLYSQEFYLFELQQGITNLVRLDTSLKVNQHFFIGYELAYESPVDTFALAYADWGPNEMKNTTLLKDGLNWVNCTDNVSLKNISLSIKPKVFDIIPKNSIDNRYNRTDNILIYPNPTKADFQVLFKETVDGYAVFKIFDLLGKKLIEYGYYQPEPNIPINASWLAPGIYLLSIDYNEKHALIKFIKE